MYRDILWLKTLLLLFVVSSLAVILVVGKQQEEFNINDILNVGIHNTLFQAIYSDVPDRNAIYDFIIVGAGPAGCVLANRLSENPNWTVYLIEAGGTESVTHQVPAFAGFLQSTHSNWGYKSVPQKHACFGMNNNECSLPRGKILGGTSSINFMIYNRGNKRDFDRWAAAGNPGWSYDEVLPYFLKSENARLAGLENSRYHNHSGPLSVEDVAFRTQFVHSYVEAAQEAGHQRTDYNGESQLGVSYVQANTLNGRRHSAFRSFIKPIRNKRPNLHILTMARVTRVLIDEKTKTAYAVEVHYENKQFVIHARKEVILSAGAFNSPQLLMLSGIGPRDNLEAIGVPIVKELPVGKLLYDHMSHFGPTFITNTTGNTIFVSSLRQPAGIQMIQEYFKGNPATLFSLIGGVESLTFLKVPGSQKPADMPDIELILSSGSMASDEGTALKQGANFKDEIYDRLYRPLAEQQQDHFSFLILQFHPKSVGRVWLHNRDPFQWPKINPKFFQRSEDVELMLQGIREAIRITQMPALKRLGTRLDETAVPGCESYTFGSDDYWRCSIRTMSYTLHHQVATCRMGPPSDPTTVVNHELKVHGIHKLRVVDTSIIPFPPTAHTNAASFMIGEKAADMIRGDWH